MEQNHFERQYREAAKRLRKLHATISDAAGKPSWAMVRQYLYEQSGEMINRGTLSGVARAKRPATPQIFRALGLPVPHWKPALACPDCGKVHLRRSRTCPEKAKARPKSPKKPWKAALYHAAEREAARALQRVPTKDEIERMVRDMLEEAVIVRG